MGKRGPKKGTGGRPKKPLVDKIAEGNPGKRPLKIVEFENVPDLECIDIPKPHDILTSVQRDGGDFLAEEIYEKTWKWINDRNCIHLVPTDLIEMYAMQTARWMQCEEAVSKYGFLGKHPTTGQASQSPFVNIGQVYLNKAERLWDSIYSIVTANCTVDYTGPTPKDDVMERLLRARKG